MVKQVLRGHVSSLAINFLSMMLGIAAPHFFHCLLLATSSVQVVLADIKPYLLVQIRHKSQDEVSLKWSRSSMHLDSDD